MRSLKSLADGLPRRAGRAVGIAVCLGCLTYFCLSVAEKWDDFSQSVWLMAGRPLLMTAEVLLMLTGIIVETLRWSTLRRGFMSGRLTDDFLATLRSIALGNSTPMNLGEHVGRGMSYPRRRIAAVVSVLASVVQTAALILLGFAGGVAVRGLGMDISRAGVVAAVVALAAALLGLAVVWRKRRRRVRAAWAVGGAFGLSLVKVLLFSLQLYLLLSAGGVGQGGLYWAVLFYYLCITVTPRVNIIDVGVKGAWAVSIFGAWVGEPVILAATVVLWALNIVVPSVCGYVVLFFAGRRV